MKKVFLIITMMVCAIAMGGCNNKKAEPEDQEELEVVGDFEGMDDNEVNEYLLENARGNLVIENEK